MYCVLGLFYDPVKTNSQSKMPLHDHVTLYILKAPLPRPLIRWTPMRIDQTHLLDRSFGLFWLIINQMTVHADLCQSLRAVLFMEKGKGKQTDV